jgi:small-conductance mechanosensitive channel
MNSRYQNFFGTVLIFFWLLLPLFSAAQLSQTGNLTDSTRVQPQAIPVINIIQKIEEANLEIKNVNRRIRSKGSVLQIDSLYAAYEKFIKVEKERVEAFMKANPNRQKIINSTNKWDGYYDQLNSWESKINGVSERNVILLEGVQFNERTWELTYQNAVSEKVPLEVLSSIKVVWNDFKEIHKNIVDQNNKYLLLETKINKLKIIVDQVIDELMTLKESEVYDLFYLRHPPLWQTSFKESDKNDLEKTEVESIPENVERIIQFFRTSESSIYLFILIVACIVFLIMLTKRTFEKYEFNEEDGDLQNAKDIILNHAVENSIFLSLVIAILFFKNLPMLLNDILGLLILIFAIPVVKPYMYKRFKKIIYFVVLFYILDSLKTYFWFSSPQYRIYLLIEALIVAAVLFAFTHPYLEIRKMKIGKFGMLLIRLTPVVYAFVLISIVSNILGYTNLTDLTLKITTQSGVFTLLFYGILMISGGLSTGLIHRYYNSGNSIDHEKKFKLEIKVLHIIRVLAFIFWLLLFLEMIDLLAPIRQFLNDILNEPYQIGSIMFSLGDILRFIFILAVSFLITSFISFLFESKEVSVQIIKLPKGVPAAISLVIRYFVIAFGIVLALSSLGIDLSKFNLMAGALGLGIGFGLQTVISNFVSGLILVFERPIHVGDTVEVNNLLGTVNRIGVRSSSIVTYDGAEVVVPNNNLIANDLINWTLSDSIKRIEILIGTTYGSDPNQILKILTDEVAKNPDALKNPEPLALFSEFGESSLNFKLRYWVHFEAGLKSKSDISIGIYNQFAAQGIEIPFPQQDVHIKNMPGMKLQGEPGASGGKKSAAERSAVHKKNPSKKKKSEEE